MAVLCYCKGQTLARLKMEDRDLYEFARLKVLKRFMAIIFPFFGAELIEVEER